MMKAKKSMVMGGIFTALAILGLVFASCSNGTTSGGSHGETIEDAIQLREGVWASGNITADGEQWFKFTATSDIHQYLHFYQETLTDIYVQMYDNTGTATGEKDELYGSNTYTARTLSNGSMYYIKVTPINSYYFGTYKIAFNTTTTAPAITLPTQNITTLNANTWADGNIPTSNGEQWFMFTATSDAQYIHFNLINLYDACVQLYDSTGTVTGERTILFGSNLYTARTLSNGSMYYIRVKQYKRADGGTYKIAFNTSTTAPSP
jgi:hypothetical protein